MADRLRMALLRPPSMRLCALVLLAAVLVRLALVSVTIGLQPFRVESQKVAATLDQTGIFADAFSAGSGPTAHVGMLTSLVTAGAYAMFGVETPLAEFTLLLIAIGLSFASYVLASQCLALLGSPWPIRAAGLLFLLFVPLQFRLEMLELRYWEVLSATCALLAMLRHVLRRDGGGALALSELLMMGAATGFIFILSPPAGIACMALVALLVMRKAQPALWPAPAIASLAMIAVLAVPWAIRNQAVLGHPVWLRSNFGMELALANHPGAVDPEDPRKAFIDRYDEMHPYENPRVLQTMRTLGGEVEYNRSLLEEAKRWIAANPGSFAVLSLRHLREFFLPPVWVRLPWQRPTPWSPNYAIIAVSAVGLATLLVRLWRDRLYLYVAAAVFVPALPYMIVQPVNRYRYLISSLLIMLAFDALGRVIARRFSAARVGHERA